MNAEKLFEAIGEVDDKFIKEAKENNKGIKKIIKIISLSAACFLVFCIIANIPNFIGYNSEGGDIYRNGYLIKDITLSAIEENFEGKLIAKNLIGQNDFEFYCKTKEFSEDENTWYSLLYSQYNKDHNVIMHCMFGEEIEEWKVDSVFTKKATQTVSIKGTEVDIAKFEPSLNFPYTNYAVFQYDGAIYDLRVYSEDEDKIYEILETLIK